MSSGIPGGYIFIVFINYYRHIVDTFNIGSVTFNSVIPRIGYFHLLIYYIL